MEKYDLIIVGTGPGGGHAGLQAGVRGKKVLTIDDRGMPGGECMFDGCIPSKLLERFADNYYLSKHLNIFEVELTGKTKINWKKVVYKKDYLVKKRSLGCLDELEKLATFKAGRAKFLKGNKIEVTDPEGKKEVFSYSKAIIATGSSPFIPPIKGNGVDKLWTNKEMFDETKLPESMIIIGGGPIGVEFAIMLAKLGVKSTIIEQADKILGPVDPEFGQILDKKMKEEFGIEILVSTKVTEVNFNDDSFKITCEKDGKSFEMQADRAMISVGRRANVEGLGLENTNVKFDPRGIDTDKYLQTSDENIYAIGDVIKGPKFMHLAVHEAGLAVNNIYNDQKIPVDLDKLSWVLFSDPEVASAGLSLEEAQKRGIDAVAEKYDFDNDPRAQINDDDSGFLKFVVDKKTLQIIGVHMIVEGASGIIGEAALIVSSKLTLNDIASAIHPHPTLTEPFGELAKIMLFKLQQK